MIALLLALLIALIPLTADAASVTSLRVEMTRTFLENAIGNPDDEFEPVVRISRDTSPATALVEIGLALGSYVTVLDGALLFGGPSGSPHLGQMIDVASSAIVIDEGRITGHTSGSFAEVLCFETLCMEPALVEIYGFPYDALVMGPGTWAFQSHFGGPTQREIAYGTYELVANGSAQVQAPWALGLVALGTVILWRRDLLSSRP